MKKKKLLQTISQAGREFAVTFKESLILPSFTLSLYLLGCHAYGLSVANTCFIYIIILWGDAVSHPQPAGVVLCLGFRSNTALL